jgi:hypothetical protein
MRRGNWFWGVFLILLGGLFLLNTVGLLDVNVWGLIWPILLILVGVWFLLAVFIAPKERVSEAGSIPLEGAQRAKIRFHHGAGRLTVRSGAEPGQLVTGTFVGGLDYKARVVGDELNVEMSPRDRFVFPTVITPWLWRGGGGMLDWEVELAEDIPLEIRLNTGANEARLDLRDLKVTDLRLEVGASSNEVILPDDAGHTHVRASAGAASLNFLVPEGVAARIWITGGLMGASVDRNRFPRTGKYYQSPDYDTAENKVDMTLEMGAGSLSVR